MLDRAGLDTMEYFGAFATHHPIQTARLTEEGNLRLALGLLEICRDTASAGPETGGAWFAMVCCVQGKASAGAAIIEAGVLEVAVAHLNMSSPVEWINWRCPPGQQAGMTFGAFSLMAQAQGAEPQGKKMLQLVVENGIADAIVSLIKAYELRGPSKVDETSVHALAHATWCLASLDLTDLTAPAARHIVQLLEGMGSALRFALDHPQNHFKYAGITTGAYLGVSAAS